MLNDQLKKAAIPLLGILIAGILYVVPEAKPLACGLGFALPSFVLGGK